MLTYILAATTVLFLSLSVTFLVLYYTSTSSPKLAPQDDVQQNIVYRDKGNSYLVRFESGRPEPNSDIEVLYQNPNVFFRFVITLKNYIGETSGGDRFTYSKVSNTFIVVPAVGSAVSLQAESLPLQFPRLIQKLILSFSPYSAANAFKNDPGLPYKMSFPGLPYKMSFDGLPYNMSLSDTCQSTEVIYRKNHFENVRMFFQYRPGSLDGTIRDVDVLFFMTQEAPFVSLTKLFAFKFSGDPKDLNALNDWLHNQGDEGDGYGDFIIDYDTSTKRFKCEQQESVPEHFASIADRPLVIPRKAA